MTLLVIAKSPRPGLVKTRLSPAYAPAEAAQIAAAALHDTLCAALAVPTSRVVLALDGPTGDWLPAGIEVVPQQGNGLDERIEAAFAHCWARDSHTPVLLVGMDTPQVDAGLLHDGSAQLRDPAVDAVLGLATDGGFWALGLSSPAPGLVAGVPMSMPDTGARQLQRLTGGGLRLSMLPELQDVDTPDDAWSVAASAPAGAFADVVRRLGRRHVVEGAA